MTSLSLDMMLQPKQVYLGNDDNMTCHPDEAKSQSESSLSLPSTQHAPGHRQKGTRCLLGYETDHLSSPCLQHVVLK